MKMIDKSTMQSLPRRILELAFNSHQINDTLAYHIYLRLRHPTHYKIKQREFNFYKNILNELGYGLVFDIGANCGSKAIILAKFADHVVCVEPSPAAIHALEERFAKFSNISVVGQGVGASPGLLPLTMFGDTGCYNTFSTKWVDFLGLPENNIKLKQNIQSVLTVPITTLDNLIERFGLPSYIKIDVEGFEIEVLKGLTRSVPLISIECNLPEFESETLECLAQLEDIQHGARFNYCIFEPPSKLVSNNWLSRAEMTKLICSRRYKFMEIYSKATNISKSISC
jgi:FkbM family methyltransferase